MLVNYNKTIQVSANVKKILVLLPKEEVENTKNYDLDRGFVIPISYKKENYYEIALDVSTLKIIDWPNNYRVIAYFNIKNNGHYVILGENNTVIFDSRFCAIKNYDYNNKVPSFLSPLNDNHLDFNIDEEGCWSGINIDSKKISQFLEENENLYY